MSAVPHQARHRGALVPLARCDRARLEATIERLIALLDAIDGDPDCEDDREGVNEDGDDLDAGEFCEAEAFDQRRPASGFIHIQRRTLP